MAKKAKSAKKTKSAKKPSTKKASSNGAEKFEFGVDDVAKALSVTATTARAILRKANVSKAGKAYGWNSKKELDAVIKKIERAGV